MMTLLGVVMLGLNVAHAYRADDFHALVGWVTAMIFFLII